MARRPIEQALFDEQRSPFAPATEVRSASVVSLRPAAKALAGRPPDPAVEAAYAAVDRRPAPEWASHTIRAYAADWRAWSGFLAGAGKTPALGDERDLAAFATWLGHRGLAPATIARRITGIVSCSQELGLDPPGTDHARRIVRAYARSGTAPRASIPRPIRHSMLRAALDAMRPAERARDARDAALLSVGWQGALRRSELTGLDWTDVRADLAGIVLVLRGTKGERTGRVAFVNLCDIADPLSDPRTCLDRWWRRQGRPRTGPVFTGAGAGAGSRLHPGSVTRIVRRRLAAAGVDVAGVSAHSLRHGFLSEAAAAGYPLHKLQRHSRHSSLATLDHYLQGSDLDADHPALRFDPGAPCDTPPKTS